MAHSVRTQKPLDYPVGRACPSGEETQIARTRAHPRDTLPQPDLVGWGDDTNADRTPIYETCLDRSIAAAFRYGNPGVIVAGTDHLHLHHGSALLVRQQNPAHPPCNARFAVSNPLIRSKPIRNAA